MFEITRNNLFFYLRFQVEYLIFIEFTNLLKVFSFANDFSYQYICNVLLHLFMEIRTQNHSSTDFLFVEALYIVGITLYVMLLLLLCSPSLSRFSE